MADVSVTCRGSVHAIIRAVSSISFSRVVTQHHRSPSNNRSQPTYFLRRTNVHCPEKLRAERQLYESGVPLSDELRAHRWHLPYVEGMLLDVPHGLIARRNLVKALNTSCAAHAECWSQNCVGLRCQCLPYHENRGDNARCRTSRCSQCVGQGRRFS